MYVPTVRLAFVSCFVFIIFREAVQLALGHCFLVPPSSLLHIRRIIAFLCAFPRDLHTRVVLRRTRYFRWRHTWF